MEQNSITSDNSVNNKTRASKMLFLKQFRNIEDPQIFQKDAQFTNGSKKMFRQAKGICTASIRKLDKLFSESQEALLCLSSPEAATGCPL